MWQLLWRNVRTAALNTTLQLLVIYRFGNAIEAGIKYRKTKAYALCSYKLWTLFFTTTQC